jgi:hypothetical protein
VLLVGAVAAAPAGAVTGGRLKADRRISITGGVVVAQNEVINGPVVSVDGSATIDGVVNDDVYVGHGNLRVNGRVTGDVFVADGDATISGRVDGDVISVLGRVVVHDGAHVGGDVVSRRSPNIASGTVRGDVRHFNLGSVLRGSIITFLVLLWIAVGVSAAILGLLFVLVFPRAADASVDAGRHVWASLGWGALVGIIGPILAVLVLVTVIGIPLGLGALAALDVLAPLGYVVASLSLGRTLVKGESTGARIGAFFAGFGILRVLALLPAIGLLVWFVACIYGLGALTIAAWRAGHGVRPRESGEPQSPADSAPAFVGQSPEAPPAPDATA